MCHLKALILPTIVTLIRFSHHRAQIQRKKLRVQILPDDTQDAFQIFCVRFPRRMPLGYFDVLG